jgi:thioredoxin reductase (NADPH)
LAPRSELVSGQVELDEAGFVRVDLRQRTSAARLYAAGDVCAGSSWTVVSAMGQAAAAVKDIERRLASGEFPMVSSPGSPFAPAHWGPSDPA